MRHLFLCSTSQALSYSKVIADIPAILVIIIVVIIINLDIFAIYLAGTFTFYSCRKFQKQIFQLGDHHQLSLSNLAKSFKNKSFNRVTTANRPGPDHLVFTIRDVFKEKFADNFAPQ